MHCAHIKNKEEKKTLRKTLRCVFVHWDASTLVHLHAGCALIYSFIHLISILDDQSTIAREADYAEDAVPSVPDVSNSSICFFYFILPELGSFGKLNARIFFFLCVFVGAGD